MDNLTGKRFGMLYVLKLESVRKYKDYYWCLCDCGKEKIICGDSMKRGMTISCGCKRKHNIGYESLMRNIIIENSLNDKNPVFTYNFKTLVDDSQIKRHILNMINKKYMPLEVNDGRTKDI